MVTFVALGLVAVPQLSATVRILVETSTLLFVPGYVLTAALFPGRNDISDFERVALSFGLSIAIVPLLAYALNYVWSVAALPIAIAITLFIVVLAAAAYVRRRALAPSDRFSVTVGAVGLFRHGLWVRSKSRLQLVLYTLLAISILFSASALAYAFVSPAPSEAYTEFYLLGPAGTMRDYPINFTLGQSKPVIVAISNHENRDVNYTLVVQLNDTLHASTLYSGHQAVGNGQTSQTTILLKPDRTGTNMRMNFLLYRDGVSSTPYRETYLLVNVTARSR